MVRRSKGEILNTLLSPVLLHASFAMHSDYSATLYLRTNNAPEVEITVIHDNIMDTTGHEFPGDESDAIALTVQDKECIIVLARGESDIIASAILQVECRLVEQIGDLLLPVAMTNIILDQHEGIVASCSPVTHTAALEAIRALEVTL